MSHPSNCPCGVTWRGEFVNHMPRHTHMALTMVIASSDAVACRVFIGCADLATEFGAWLQLQGWHVRIESSVDPRTQPRIAEEEEMAGALTAEFDKWKGTR